MYIKQLLSYNVKHLLSYNTYSNFINNEIDDMFNSTCFCLISYIPCIIIISL